MSFIFIVLWYKFKLDIRRCLYMKNKIIICILFFASIIPFLNCKAMENGFVFNKTEIRFIEEFYGKEFLKTINLENNGYEIFSSIIKDSISLLSTSVTESNKKIIIAKSCSTKCIVITKVEWNKTPFVTSYDVIGSRITGGLFSPTSLKTKIKYGSTSKYEAENLFFQNGYGTIVKLPVTNYSIIIEQQIEVSGNGKIFSSYQHSKNSLSLFDSKQFLISSSGYGGVFQFYGQALNQYDNMPGVYVSF